MALHQSPKIVTDGLVFAYDMSNGKSFQGGPVTNTLPSPSINGYPTTGNGWGTYNTNQYNGAAYFSIGSISSVSGNIVTTSGNHPLRSYDVVTPQSSGGGLSAGTNYLVKKISDTTFSLHTWNSSQDGSQGYINLATGNHKVYDDFANDVRISVNSSSFPTMWWGPPHLPNSGLVKEIISQGFDGIVGRQPTDCVRLHFIRSDNVTDGMAYSVDASVTAGVQHTVSFWTRSVTPSAVGQYLSYSIYNYGVTTPTGHGFTAYLGPVGVWTKQQMTFTPNNPYAISYWFPSTGQMKVDVSNIQFETGTIANNFAPGSRSSTQVLLDQTNNSTPTATSLTYSSDGTFSFNGSSSSVTGSVNSIHYPSTNSIDRSWEVFVKPTITHSTAGLFGHVVGAGCTYYCNGGVCIWSGNYAFNWFDNSAYQFLDSGVAATSGQWAHVVGTYSSSDGKTRIYVNGVLRNTSGSSTNLNYGGNAYYYQTGYLSASGNYFTGNMSVVKYYYNKALSAGEVQQNFNALRGRYGI